MTNFLVHRFVKDSEQTNNPKVRTQYGVLASFVGIFCNLILFAGKLAVGILLHSIAVMADAFNNLSDAASSIIGFVGVKMASKPADEDHPFGHGRIEYITALIVSFLVMQVGWTFFKSSFGKIREPEELTFSLVPLLILLASVGMKLWLGQFNRILGKRINSKVMLATAADAMGDVITTSATIFSILVFRFTGFNIDGYVGLLVALVVMWAGLGIARDTLEPLLGAPVDPELYRQITEKVESYEGIVGSHDLIVHNYGPTRSLASIHAEVPNNVDIEISHEIIDRIEREVARELNIFLVIHMDPVETCNSQVTEAKTQVEELMRGIDESLSLHDFRMVSGEHRTNLIFDIVVPASYSSEKLHELSAQVAESVHRENPQYQCVITAEKSFVAEG